MRTLGWILIIVVGGGLLIGWLFPERAPQTPPVSVVQASPPPTRPPITDEEVAHQIDPGAIPNVGENGHSARDVAALRRGALDVLKGGVCQRVELANNASADVSPNAEGLYLVSCENGLNRYFRMRGEFPSWCGEPGQRC